MIELCITRTGKSPSSQTKWTCYDESVERFMSLEEAHAWLKREYAYCKKRVPCYRDVPGGPPVQCGYIYCFKVKEDGRTHYEQHWVSFSDVRITPIDIRANR